MQRHWVVVGGWERGGVLVRRGGHVASEKEEERLQYAAIVEELEVVGDRLHYRLLHGTGPREGWITTYLPPPADKELVARAYPSWVTRPGGLPLGADADAAAQPVAMTFYAISDVHVELRHNMQWLEELPTFERSTVIVAGDVGVQVDQVESALTLFRRKFDHVFYCFGNHETWVHKARDNTGHANSFEKLTVLREVCNRLGVFTTPQLIEGVWVVPVLGWYHACWDTEPPLQAPAGKELVREPMDGVQLATDTLACQWPSFENGSLDLARELDRQNEAWGIWPLPEGLLDNLTRPRGTRQHPVITFSHFLPRIELMPEKRFLFQPNLTKVVGSKYVQDRISKLEPDLHIFGHSHFPWDVTLGDGVRYRSWPLGSPEEQSRRIVAYPTEHTERWHPLPVFDSEGRQYSGDEACWFAMMYTRIKRDPTSCRMAQYVKLAYCPDAPEVPLSIISPGNLLEAEDAEQQERRERHQKKSSVSMTRQVKRAEVPPTRK